MEWMDYNWRMGIYPDLNNAPKYRDWKWDGDDGLPPWDGQFDEMTTSDTEVNGGIYGFSEDSEADALYDREMLGVSVDTILVISYDDTDSDYRE